MKIGFKYLKRIVKTDAAARFHSKLHLASEFFDNYREFKDGIQAECANEIEVWFLCTDCKYDTLNACLLFCFGSENTDNVCGNDCIGCKC